MSNLMQQVVPEGYKLTEVGVIPEDWTVAELQSICRAPITYGIVQCGPNISNGVPYIRVSDMNSYSLNISEMLRTSESIAAGFSRSRVDEGDIVYALRGKLGEVRIVDSRVAGANLTQGTARLAPSKSVIGDYLLWSLRSSASLKQALQEAKGSTFVEITLADLKQIKIPIPLAPQEQHAIADALNEIDTLVASLEKLIAKKRAIKTAAMQQLLTGKKRLPPFDKSHTGYKQTELGEIPEDWEVKSLGDLGGFKNGINKDGDSFGHGHPFVNLMDIFGKTSITGSENFGLIDSTDLDRKEYTVIEGDVLFIRSSVKPSGVGLTAVVLSDLKNTVYSGFLIRYRSKGELEKHYQEFCFHEQSFRRRIIAASSVSANTNINQDNLKKLVLAYPSSLEEQAKIAEVLSDLNKDTKLLEERLNKTQQLKQGMMQELLTGKTRLTTNSA